MKEKMTSDYSNRLFIQERLEKYPLNYQRISVVEIGKGRNAKGYKGIKIPSVHNNNAFNLYFYKSISKFEV
jgi:hypothetical protein